MFKRIIIALAASVALVVSTGGAALACVVDPPPEDVCYGTPIHHPEEGHEIIVVDQEAYDDDPTWVEDSAAHWQRWSANGSWKNDYAPPFPGDQWTSNVAGDPHGVGVAGSYFRSNGNSGNVDWFYLEWVDATGHEEPGEHHDAITHPEWVVDVEEYDEPVIVDCDEPDPTVVTPQFHYVPPTCDLAGFIDEQSSDLDGEGITWEFADNGDGTGVWHAVLASGFVFPEGFNPDDAFFYVPDLSILPADSDECYNPPPPTCEQEPGHWTNIVWHTWTGGPILSPTGPAADGDGWNANNGDPQSENHAFVNHFPGVPYFVSHGNSGNGDWFLWTADWDSGEIDCPPPPPGDEPVAAQFNVEGGDPTCEDAAVLDTSVFPIVRDGYTLVVDRPYDGPGDYTITAIAHTGFVIEGAESVTITLDGALGFQSEDPTVECYVAPPECTDINTASFDDLVALDGINTVLAERIIEGRPFVSIHDLVRVDGIGERSVVNLAEDNDLCPIPPVNTPPVVTPPVVVPPVVVPPVVPAVVIVPATPYVAPYVAPAPTLASTGSEGAVALGIGALVLLGLGSALTVARRRYSRS